MLVSLVVTFHVMSSFFPAFLVYDWVKAHLRRLTYLGFLQSVVREVTNVEPCLALLMSETGKGKKRKHSNNEWAEAALGKVSPGEKRLGTRAHF